MMTQEKSTQKSCLISTLYAEKLPSTSFTKKITAPVMSAVIFDSDKLESVNVI
jgi:hypothetical protein